MGTTAQKLQYLNGTKTAIKDIIQSAGVNISSNDTFRSYADKIQDLIDINRFNALPATNVVLGSTTVAVSPFINIYADDKKTYTPQEWYELPSDVKGVTIKPIGFDMRIQGQHFILYIKEFGNTDLYTYYDITGQYTQTDGGLRHSICNYTPVTSARNYTNPSGETATCTISGTSGILSASNCARTWEIPNISNASTRNAWFDYYKNDAIKFEALYIQNEWLRHAAAKEGPATQNSEVDGTYADRVDIVMDGPDMVFKIIVDANDNSKDITTSILAKYNLHSYCTSAGPTQTIVDYIYTQQLANGVNMNSGLDPNDAKKVLTPGTKGAEAYVYNGKWWIITPILSNCATNVTNLEKNIPDSPAIYYVKNIIQAEYGNDAILANEYQILSYLFNKSRLNSLLTFLRGNDGGKCTWLPSGTISVSCWLAPRSSATSAWSANTGGGGVYAGNVFYRYRCFSASLAPLALS